MLRIFFFLIGFGLMVIGSIYSIAYLNLLTIGYTISDYFTFIIQKIECNFLLAGFIISTIAIFMKGELKNDLHIRYTTKPK